MFKWFKKNKKNTHVKDFKDEYWVEYFPVTGFYFPRFNNYYLYKDHNTGILTIYEVSEYRGVLAYAERFSGIEGRKKAIECLSKFKEQQNKELRLKIRTEL